MRKDQVTPGRKVRVRHDAPLPPERMWLRGKEGEILSQKPDVPVRIHGYTYSAFHFKPEWLDYADDVDINVGDVVLVRAEVVKTNGNFVKVQLQYETPAGWILRRHIGEILEQALWYPPQPEIGTVVRGINLTENTPMGTWVRQSTAKKGWFDLVHGGDLVDWAHVVDTIRNGGAVIQMYAPTTSIDPAKRDTTE